MILVLFHVLYFFGKFVYQSYRTKRQAIKDDAIGTEKRFNITGAECMLRDPEAPQDYMQKSIRFFPPAYVQRYVAVIDVIRNWVHQKKIRKVVDFGCAELDFLIYMKNTQGIEEILCVDIDRTLLESFKDRAAPLVCEYLNTRTEPLVIEVCEGSVTSNDKKLEKTDAVICIELIEHLYPDELTDLPHNIFGYVQPKLVLITTPNADFNVLFPNFSGFRHPDHKFEWTRQQFQDWAENVTARYPDYAVKFEGICKGPEGTEHLGCCTQMAIFERVTDKEVYSRGIEGLFKTVARYEYPFRVDNRSDEEKILDEATFYIRQLSSFSIEDGAMEAVPLEQLVNMLKRMFHVSVESLKTILEEANWTIEDHELGPVVIVPEQSFSDYDQADDDVQWDDDPSIDEDTWTQELGPPVNSRYSRRDSSAWDNQNWDQEPSIIIPENNPVALDVTDMFDEAVLTLDSVSEVINDAETVDGTIETSGEYVNPMLGAGNVSDALVDSSSGREFEEDTREDSFLETTPDTRDDVVFNSVQQRLNRTLDVPLYMSVSRASTSPEPYLLQAVRIDQSLQNDSMCDHSMSSQWTLNNSLEQKIIMGASEDECHRASKGSNLNDEDHYLRRIYLNTSYKEIEDSDVERVSVNANENATCLGREQTPSVQRDGEPSRNEHLQHLNPVPNASILIESSPQFTSSPKTLTKPNTMSKKRRSLDYKGSKSENSSSDTTGFTTSYNDSSDISKKVSPRNNKSVHISTATTVSFSDSDVSTYLNETGLTNSCNDTRTSSDTSTMGSTFNDNKETTEEFSDSSSLSSNEKGKSVTNLDSSVADASSGEDRATLRLSNGAESSNCDTEIPLTSRESCVDFVSDMKTESEAEPLDDRYSRVKDVNSTGACRRQAKDVSVESSKPLEPNESARDAQSVLKSEKCTIRDANAVSIEIVESIELKPSSPETAETPSTSWSPEVMDSGYPNTASAQDMTPEYDLSSFAQDHISDSEPPSIAEAPRPEALEVVQVENGDLANNNRDGEGNNMMAAELNDLEDLQPLIDVLENDIENENDIYVLENGFPMWLLRILNMANPLDVEMRMQERRELRLGNRAPADDDDEGNVNADRDEGFNSSAEEDSDLENNEMRGNANVADENVLMDNAENVSNSDSGSEQWVGDT